MREINWETEERFWRNVNKLGPKGCWSWTGSKTHQGYGQISINGKSTLAHRASYVINIGHIPESDTRNKYCVLHKCDNPNCVNPDHLFIGTHKDNAIDMINKGRHGRTGSIAKPLKDWK